MHCNSSSWLFLAWVSSNKVRLFLQNIIWHLFGINELFSKRQKRIVLLQYICAWNKNVRRFMRKKLFLVTTEDRFIPATTYVSFIKRFPSLSLVYLFEQDKHSSSLSIFSKLSRYNFKCGCVVGSDHSPTTSARLWNDNALI